MRRTLGRLAALAAGGYGAAVLWFVADAAWSLVPMLPEFRRVHGSFGAVSSEIAEGLLLVAVLPFLASVGANRGLVRWARRSDGLGVRLHRAHSFLLLVCVFTLFAPLVLSFGFGVPVIAIAWMGLGLVVAFTVGVQSIALSVMLMLFARAPR